MITPFTSDELARMQSAQVAGMMDTCVIYRYAAGTPDAYGKPADVWTSGTSAACGLAPNKHNEVMDGAQVVLSDAVLRLPLTAVIGGRDRVLITHRFGVALGTPLAFELIGEPMRGPSGLRVNLRTLTNTGALEAMLPATMLGRVTDLGDYRLTDLGDTRS